MNRSAVSRVRYFAGKLFSIPSSSVPPNGGFVRITSTRSAGPWLAYGLASVLPWRTAGARTSWRSRLVVARRCGSCFFSTPRMVSCNVFRSATVSIPLPRKCSMASTRKPPVPQAGSSTTSPSAGSVSSVITLVTARGV